MSGHNLESMMQAFKKHECVIAPGIGARRHCKVRAHTQSCCIATTHSPKITHARQTAAAVCGRDVSVATHAASQVHRSPVKQHTMLPLSACTATTLTKKHTCSMDCSSCLWEGCMGCSNRSTPGASLSSPALDAASICMYC